MVACVNNKFWGMIAIFMVACLMLATNSSGHNWGGDFSQYVHHAVNLVDGHPYADTRYIYSPFTFMGPDVYPPIFPLLLAPLYLLFGLNWIALKSVIVVCFCLSLLITILIGGKTLGRAHTTMLFVILAANPYLWELKDQLLSDFPFLFFCMLTLFLLKRRYTLVAGSYTDSKKDSRAFALLLGLLLYICYGTREIGIVFIPVVLLFELFHFRKISFTTLIAILVFALMAGLQNLALKSSNNNFLSEQQAAEFSARHGVVNHQTSHLDHFTASPSLITKQAVRYAHALRDLWPDDGRLVVNLAGWGALFLILGLALIAYTKAVISGPGIIDTFVAGYLAVLLMFSGFQGLRYLLPVIPLLFLYAFTLHFELFPAHTRIMSFVAFLFIAFTLVTYTFNNKSYLLKEDNGITSADAAELFDYVRDKTPENSVFLFQRPRVLSLLTGRYASSWPYLPTKVQNLISDYTTLVGVNYIVFSDISWSAGSKPLQSQPDIADYFTSEFIHDHQFTLVFSNACFLVYEVSHDKPIHVGESSMEL